VFAIYYYAAVSGQPLLTNKYVIGDNFIYMLHLTQNALKWQEPMRSQLYLLFAGEHTYCKVVILQ